MPPAKPSALRTLLDLGLVPPDHPVDLRVTTATALHAPPFVWHLPDPCASSHEEGRRITRSVRAVLAATDADQPNVTLCDCVRRHVPAVLPLDAGDRAALQWLVHLEEVSSGPRSVLDAGALRARLGAGPSGAAAHPVLRDALARRTGQARESLARTLASDAYTRSMAHRLTSWLTSATGMVEGLRRLPAAGPQRVLWDRAGQAVRDIVHDPGRRELLRRWNVAGPVDRAAMAPQVRALLGDPSCWVLFTGSGDFEVLGAADLVAGPDGVATVDGPERDRGQCLLRVPLLALFAFGDGWAFLSVDDGYSAEAVGTANLLTSPFQPIGSDLLCAAQAALS